MPLFIFWSNCVAFASFYDIPGKHIQFTYDVKLKAKVLVLHFFKDKINVGIVLIQNRFLHICFYERAKRLMRLLQQAKKHFMQILFWKRASLLTENIKCYLAADYRGQLWDWDSVFMVCSHTRILTRVTCFICHFN